MRKPPKQAALLGALMLTLGQWSAPSYGQHSDALELYQASLAATCANCHGTAGHGVQHGGMPLINNMRSDQMLTILLEYKTGARSGTIMPQLCKGYTDEQLQTIALQLGKKQ